MLRTRLWMGAILIVLTVGVLVLDQWLAPWYPFLLVLVLGLTLVGCHELLQLLGKTRRPAPWLCYTAVAAIVAANWLPSVAPGLVDRDPWIGIVSMFTMAVLGAFVTEMATFSVPGESVARIALTVWIAA